MSKLNKSNLNISPETQASENNGLTNITSKVKETTSVILVNFFDETSDITVKSDVDLVIAERYKNIIELANKNETCSYIGDEEILEDIKDETYYKLIIKALENGYNPNFRVDDLTLDDKTKYIERILILDPGYPLDFEDNPEYVSFFINMSEYTTSQLSRNLSCILSGHTHPDFGVFYNAVKKSPQKLGSNYLKILEILLENEIILEGDLGNLLSQPYSLVMDLEQLKNHFRNDYNNITEIEISILDNYKELFTYSRD